MAQPVSEKIASLEAIPSSLISAAERAIYIQRATCGANVYAYPAGPQSQERLWNVWDTDTRIPYPSLEKQWRIVFLVHEGQGLAHRVVLTRGENKRDILLYVLQLPCDTSRDCYLSRSERVIRAAVNQIARVDHDPYIYHKMSF